MWTKELSKSEFDCKETGTNAMDEQFMKKLNQLRQCYGKPFVITSGFRSLVHSAERKKLAPGNHTKGIAVDIKCHSDEAYEIIKWAMLLGFTGIGVSQKGTINRFIHLDMRTDTPRVYSY